MSEETIKLENRKNEVLIKYLRTIFADFNIWAEYDTDKTDVKVITVQEQVGQKIVMWQDRPLFNYYAIDIFGLSIREMKQTASRIGLLIGQSILIDLDSEDNTKLEKWQIIFKQYSNPQTVEYADIRRVSYNAILQCIVGKVYETDK